MDLHLAQGTENEGVSRVSFGFFLTKVGDLINRTLLNNKDLSLVKNIIIVIFDTLP